MPDLWLTCDHFVGKVFSMGQPTRPTQPSIPSWSATLALQFCWTFAYSMLDADLHRCSRGGGGLGGPNPRPHALNFWKCSELCVRSKNADQALLLIYSFSPKFSMGKSLKIVWYNNLTICSSFAHRPQMGDFHPRPPGSAPLEKSWIHPSPKPLYWIILGNKDPAHTCEHCKCILTMEHILSTCTKYEHNRKRYYLSRLDFHTYYCILQNVIFSTMSLISTF